MELKLIHRPNNISVLHLVDRRVYEFRNGVIPYARNVKLEREYHVGVRLTGCWYPLESTSAKLFSLNKCISLFSTSSSSSSISSILLERLVLFLLFQSFRI